MAVAPAAALVRNEAVGLISTPCRAGWPEQHRQPRHGHNNGESSQQDWVDGLKVEPAELSCVQLEQPEGINVLLQQQAVDGAGSCGDQQWCCGDRHQPAMNAPCLCLLYTSPSPRDRTRSRMPSSA